jgi:hypothetical protein
MGYTSEEYTTITCRGMYDHNLVFYEQVTPGVLGEKPVKIKL